MSQFQLRHVLCATLTARKQWRCPVIAAQGTSRGRKTLPFIALWETFQVCLTSQKLQKKSTHCPKLQSPSEQLEQYLFLKASEAGHSVPSSANLYQGCFFPSVIINKTATMHSPLLFTSFQCITFAALVMFFHFPP